MTKEEFDNYRFSIKTEICYVEGVWEPVIEVHFVYRKIAIEHCVWIDYSKVKGIREANA